MTKMRVNFSQTGIGTMNKILPSVFLSLLISACSYNKEEKANALAKQGFYEGQAEKIEAGVKILTEEIKSNPNDAGLYLSRGYLYIRIGQVEKSLKDTTKAIEIDPTWAHPYNNRCYTYYQEGNYTKALLDCDKAISLDSKYWQAYDSRGDLRLAMGDTEGACSDYKNAVKFDDDPDNDPFTYGEKNGKKWLTSDQGNFCK